MVHTKFARICLYALLVFGLVACKSELYSDLSQKEVNEMSAVLSKYGIDSVRKTTEAGMYSLHVEKSDFANSVELLSREGYPKEQFQAVNEVFAPNRLITSTLEQRTKLAYVTGQELSRTLTDVDGVTKARVHVVLPEVTPLGKEIGEPSASVTLHYNQAANANELMVHTKHLVANSVKDLERDRVSVALFPATGIGENLTEQADAYRARKNSSMVSSWLWSLATFLMVFGILTGIAYYVLGRRS